MTSLILLLALLAPARAAVADVQSPAMRQLQGLEGQHPEDAPQAEGVKAGGNLGFTVQTLAPEAYIDERGNPAAAPTAPQRPPLGENYVFEGKSGVKGVTVYAPKADPTGSRKTEPPKEGMGSGLLLYGALGAGAALIIAGVSPLIIVGLLVAVVAALFFINRKTA